MNQEIPHIPEEFKYGDCDINTLKKLDRPGLGDREVVCVREDRGEEGGEKKVNRFSGCNVAVE